MTIPRLYEGGLAKGEQMLVPDRATVRAGLITDPAELERASLSAIALFNSEEPYIVASDADYVSLRWHDSGTSKPGIYDKRADEALKDLVLCADRLIQLSGVESAYIPEVNVFRIAPGKRIDLSEEPHNTVRSEVLLSGTQILKFVHAGLSAKTELIQVAGDARQIRYAADSSGFKYGIDTITRNDESLYMFVDSDY